MNQQIEIRIVEVLDKFHVILNAGSLSGLSVGTRLVIYGRWHKVKDLDGKDLGALELSKGYGKLFHVQEQFSILESELGRGFEAIKDISYLSSVDNGLGSLSLGLSTPEFMKVRAGDYARAV